MRFEIKLKDVRKIKDLLSNLDLVHERQIIGGVTFKTLFSKSIAKAILLDFYRKIYNNITVPQQSDLNAIAEHIFEDKNLLTGKRFSSIGVLFCLLYFGRDRAVNVCYKKVLEVEKLIKKIKKSDLKRDTAGPLNEIYNALCKFELITELESGPLTAEDEDVIGYRKRPITPQEEEQIYMDALNKYLPSPDQPKYYRKKLSEILDLLAGRPLPETHKEMLGLYFETEKLADERKGQDVIKRAKKRGDKFAGSTEIINPALEKDNPIQAESPEEMKARQNAVRQYMEEMFAEERKRAEEQRKMEKKNAVRRAENPNAPRRRGKFKEESKSEDVKLLTPEEMFQDVYYHEQKIAQETPEQFKVREDAIAEQERIMREIERQGTNVIVYDGHKEELKMRRPGSKAILNPNYREKKKPEESQAEVIPPKRLTKSERQAQWQRETDEYNQRMEQLRIKARQEETEALNNESKYNDSS